MPNHSDAAQELVQRRLTNTAGPRLKAPMRPNSLEQAWRIQTEVSAMLAEKGNPVKGWKCLLPPADKRVIGPIYEKHIWQHSPCNILALDDCAAIEPEFAFVFAKSLAPEQAPFDEATVKGALAGVHLAFELIKSRYNNPSECEFAELLADGLHNQGLLLGPRIESWPTAECQLELHHGDHHETLAGVHPNRDAFAPVVWLANYLAEVGLTLEAGHAVITGSYAGVLKVPFDTAVTVNYTGFGELTATFTRADP